MKILIKKDSHGREEETAKQRKLKNGSKVQCSERRGNNKPERRRTARKLQKGERQKSWREG